MLQCNLRVVPIDGSASLVSGGKAMESKTQTLAAVIYVFFPPFGAVLSCFGVVSVAKLNDRQKRFVAEYLVDLNATAAAKRAGYSGKTAKSQGQRLLTNVDIQVAIQKRREKLQSKLEITQEMVLQELAAVAFANGTDFAQITRSGMVCLTPTEALPEHKRKAVASIKEGQYGAEVKLHDKVRALELLGKHLGVFAAGGPASAQEDNNIFEVIDQSTREEIDTDGIPEIEPPAEPGDDVVE